MWGALNEWCASVWGWGGGAWGTSTTGTITQDRKQWDAKDRIFLNTVEGCDQELGQRPRFSLELRGPSKAQK